jgi:hypothetical protein
VKIIALLTVIALWLFAAFGTKSSVGGPITMMLILFIAMLAVGLYEAWLKKRGVLGWIVNIPASIVGGLMSAFFAVELLEVLILLVPVQGSLAASQHPMLYVMLAAQAILTLLGTWFTLQLVNRYR